MSELKCPFCQRKLKTFAKYKDGTSTVYCSKCNLFGDSKLFSELIRTRKALDVAKERLKNTILDAEILATPEYLASRAKETLDEITALEKSELENLEMLVNNVFK